MESGNESIPTVQPEHIVEEIDAIIALIIYDSYSKRYEYTLSAQHRGKRFKSANIISDDIDRFDSIYSCLIDQSPEKKYHRLSDQLRNRFFNIPNIDQFKIFQQNEYSRIYKEKQKQLNRVEFIPNVLTYQRTCPIYDLEEMKWIREHLC